MSECTVTFEYLADFADQAHSLEEMQWMQAHLETGCEKCQKELQRIARVLAILHSPALQSVPSAQLTRAARLFAPREATITPLRWIASLISDSRAVQTFSFARGDQEDGARLLFSADRFDIDLWEERLPSSKSYLIGQIVDRETGETIAPNAARLREERGEEREALLDSGEFHFDEVSAGVYQITLQTDTGEFVLPDVGIGEASLP